MHSKMFAALLVLFLASLATPATPATPATDPPPGIEQMHEEMLFSVALIRMGRSSGSGTVIYSAERDGEWATYILTNYRPFVAMRMERNTTWRDGLPSMCSFSNTTS